MILNFLVILFLFAHINFYDDVFQFLIFKISKLNEIQNNDNKLKKFITNQILETFINYISIKFLIYELEEYYLSKEEIMNMAKSDAKNFLYNDILPNCKDAEVLTEDIEVTYEDEEKISLNVIYKINEEVGYFKGR